MAKKNPQPEVQEYNPIYDPEYFYKGVESGEFRLKPFTHLDGEGSNNFYITFPSSGTNKVVPVNLSDPDIVQKIKYGIPASDSQVLNQRAEEKARTLKGIAKTAAIEAADAATFGLTSPELVKRGIVTAEDIEAGRKENPITAAVASFAPDVAALLATGGGSAAASAAKIAGSTGATAAKKTLGQTVKSAATDAFTAAPRLIDQFSDVAANKAMDFAAKKGIGETGQKAAASAARFGTAGGTYYSLDQIREDRIQNREITPEAILANFSKGFLGASLLGGGGSLLLSSGKFAAKAAGEAAQTVANKTRKYAKDLYPKIIGEEATTDLNSDLLLDQRYIDALNAYGVNIPQVTQSGGPKRVKETLDYIFGATLKGDPTKPLYVPGENAEFNVKRLVGESESIGNSLKQIYKTASKDGVIFNKPVSQIEKESMEALANDGFASTDKIYKVQKRVNRQILGEFRNKKIIKQYIPEIKEIAVNFKKSANQIPGLEYLPKQLVNDAYKSIVEATKYALANKKTQKEAAADAFARYEKKREESASVLYNGFEEQINDSKVIKKFFEDTFNQVAKLTIKDAQKIKKKLQNIEKVHKNAQGYSEESDIASRMFTYINNEMADAIVNHRGYRKGKKALKNTVKDLTKTFALTRKFTEKAAYRQNMVGMQDKKGLLSRVSNPSTIAGSVLSGIGGTAIFGPVGGLIGAAIPAAKTAISSFLDEQGKSVLPGIRARRAFDLAGVVSADSQTRGYFGKLEKLVNNTSLFSEIPKKGKSPKKNDRLKKYKDYKAAFEVLGISPNDSPKKKSQKVAEYSDSYRLSVSGESGKPTPVQAGMVQFNEAFGTDNPNLLQTKEGYRNRLEILQAAILEVLPEGPAFSNPQKYTPLVNFKWEASPTQTERTLRILDAAQDPVAEIVRALDGDVNVKAIELVQKAYPETYQAFMNIFLGNLAATRKTPLSIEEKSVIDALTVGTKYENTGFSDKYNTYKNASASPSAKEAERQASTGSGGPKLTQNATKNIGAIGESVGTFSDTVGTKTN